ncbi:hypothetical protein LOH54_04970 [Sulfurimonas sp. HSL-3221]|uniref:hypothetical protein n=1 Tax=Thiomicrolovo sulfuroxydans TaxID=2894755 RepID=UPI001E63E766|nr:hypothetical protein [Sulfurimonas sp. HSL-3221]UFS63484.1 hypothetical protein LOH54_04970 [Sulfurimonas sp. HSL-3221]
MSRVSINGILKPTDDTDVTDQYLGHFLKVSYIQEIGGHSTYSKDRVDVQPNGAFRFFLPQQELLASQSVTVEVYAPDGELLGSQIYSYGSLNASNTDASAEDDTQPMEIGVDPKVITFGDSNPITDDSRLVSGMLVDISGERSAAGLSVVLMVTTDPDADPGSEGFHPLFSVRTNKDGSFFARVGSEDYAQAYGIVAGLEETPIPVTLSTQENKQIIPKNILLVADLSTLPEGIGDTGSTPTLPETAEMIGNPSFTQDLGGKCVDFTIPNRTLEEYSFYHTVRTTEPEIRGLTITAKESKKLKTELLDISETLFGVFSRMNSSMKTLSLNAYTVDDEKTAQAMTTEQPTAVAEPVMMRSFSSGTAQFTTEPVYHLKMETAVGQLKFSSANLTSYKLDFSALLKILAEQARRKTALQELHRELAAAYCGKKGAREAETYCESLASEDALNRATVASLLGHIKTYADAENSTLFAGNVIPNQIHDYIKDFQSLVKQPFVDAGLITVMQKRAEKLIGSIDLQTKESQDQEELLGYFRRLVSELAEVDQKGFYTFEPCPTRETDTMGILCIMQQFEQIRETLRNKTVFTLGEILSIRDNYDTYVTSISAFLSLLERFHTFYTTGSNLLISLEDDYFVQHYHSTKSALSTLKRQIYAAITRIEALEAAYISNHPGRRELTVETSIDWDETPTVYENTTIAHGHILHFKQKWKADGYSLGDLLYSLPLAPCQEKQIAIIDWDREERASRTEAQTVAESLTADLSRDRDISEIINSSFQENISASSTNKTSSTSAGIGGGIVGGIGGLFGGVSHSGASSRSTANQDSARNLSGSTLNRLQDNISQSASSLRSQRSTVVQTVGQNETMTVQTEVVKNNNHCHAMTVEYFEVLKHYAIEQELADVQECLFVPLPMSDFDHAKILRWKDTLRRAVYGTQLRRGFDAIERMANNYADSDLPEGSYADETIQNFSGHFSISFELKRPYISQIEEQTKTITETVELKEWFFWYPYVLKFTYDKEVPLTEAEKDAIFEADYAPEIVRKFIDTIDIYGIDESGSEVRLDLDYTLMSNYRKGIALQVNIASKEIPTVTRRQIQHLRFRANTTVHASSKIILRTAYLHYRTNHMSSYIVRNGRVNNDIINIVKVSGVWFDPTIEVVTDAALLYTPLTDKELRDPRKEDRKAAAALVSHLNEHLELSHKVIWTSLDASRLFGLLDGYIAPNSGNKSVASVVENKVMGVVGNNLVLKVVPGERLDPVFRNVEDLIGHYKTATKPDPFRISVPTKGVYAESVMGKCNSCEPIDDTRHWRFKDEPCGTTPTPIAPVSTDSRQSDVGSLQVKDLPSSIINMQTAPNAPDPTGLGAAFELLGKSDAFKDMTGLAGTQANAIKALETTSKSVTDLAGMAADLKKQTAMKKDIGKTLQTIDDAKKKNQISDMQANGLSYSALSSMVGEPTKKEAQGTTVDEVKDLAKSAGDNKASVKVNRPSGEQIEVDARPQDAAAELEFSTKTAIILPTPQSSPDSRAFFPSRDDKSGVIEVAAQINNAPSGGSHRWTRPDVDAMDIDAQNSLRTIVRGKKPGLQELDFTVRDSAGSAVASQKLTLCIPQFVTIDEDAIASPTPFDDFLAQFKLDAKKNEVLQEAKEVCDHLLRTSNVRTIWRVGPFSETVPAHLPANHVTTLKIHNEPPAIYAGTPGVTHTPAGAAVLNETIDIYPGALDDSNSHEISIEVQALLIQIQNQTMTADLESFATTLLGRLLGSIMSHEIIHSLLAFDIPSGHNAPKIPGDIMNQGTDLTFTELTGFEDTAHTSPLDPIDFIDHGIVSLAGLLATNQGRMDARFPVPPAFT